MSKIPQKICRICEQDTATQLINISLKNNFQSLIHKYLACANVTFDINDELPKYFCRDCISILKIAYNFKIKCEQTQKKFKKLLQIDFPSGLVLIKIENVEVPISNENIPSNLVEVEIEPHDLKLEYSDHESIDNVSEKEEVDTDKLKSNDHKSDELIMKKCPICLKEFKLRSSLLRHTKQKHTTVKQQCEYCDETFTSAAKFSLHVKLNHPEANSAIDISGYECFMCDSKLFKKKRYLLRHMKTVHISNKIKQSFPCEICGKIFAFINNKRRHIKVVHLNERLFVCQSCGKCFGSFIELESHETVHSDEKKFECSQCMKKYKTKHLLRHHIHVKHGNYLRPKNDEDRLKVIQRRRAYDKSHRKCCEICGKTMGYYQLAGHMRMHSGIKPYQCELCLKTFISKRQLEIHVLVHTGERPYKCEYCPKRFRQLSHTYAHQLIHTGEKPFKCAFCQKAFAQNGNLREHERMHTGEKPYQCNLCVEKFANLKALKRHATKMHTGRESEALIYSLPSSSSQY